MDANDDKVLFVQTFSKNWAMTGWRIGWLEAPGPVWPGHRESDSVFDIWLAGLRPARCDCGA
jgi:aspartate/methionine/tyrosine aminotransferase